MISIKPMFLILVFLFFKNIIKLWSNLWMLTLSHASISYFHQIFELCVWERSKILPDQATKTRCEKPQAPVYYTSLLGRHRLFLPSHIAFFIQAKQYVFYKGNSQNNNLLLVAIHDIIFYKEFCNKCQVQYLDPWGLT